MAVSADQSRWVPLESNPEVLSKYIQELGAPDVEFTDVMGFDEELLAMVPQPVHAVLLLFPISEAYERHRIAEDNKIKETNPPVSPKVFYVEQTIDNACGTMGCVHSVCNTEGRVKLTEGSFFEKYLRRAFTLPVQDRAKELESSSELSRAHSVASHQGQSTEPAPDEDIILHFTAFVCVEGVLYELDGRRPGPVPRGPSSPASLLQDAAKAIRVMMALDPLELHYTALALVPIQ
jgi:ubiquitin carboxyl-terminal hydrolase L3